MGNERRERRLTRRVGLLAALGIVLTGCITGPERLVGPTVSVRNDSGKPIVVRIQQSKYEVGPDESRHLYLSYHLHQKEPASVEVLDSASCEVARSIIVTFETDLDPLVTVPVSGPLTQSVQTLADQQTDWLKESWNACPEPADGWTISVSNPSSTIYRLIAYDKTGTALWQGKAPPESSQTIRLGGYKHGGSGSIVLLDAECRVLDRVEHADTGTYVITIRWAAMTIKAGRIPSDDPDMTVQQWACPAPTPSPR